FGDVWIGAFEVDRRVGMPESIASGRVTLPFTIAAEKLLSLTGIVDGTSRSAIAGQTPGGFLTFGPYAMLAPGKYEITIEYGPSAGTQKWDVAVGGEGRVVASGVFAPTDDVDARVIVPFDQQGITRALQVRSLFSGIGRLTVRSITIRSRE